MGPNMPTLTDCAPDTSRSQSVWRLIAAAACLTLCVAVPLRLAGAQAPGTNDPFVAPAPPRPPAAAPLPERPIAAPNPGPRSVTPGTVFRDCAGCPELVVVPGGRFEMGSPTSESGRGDDEGPQRWVSVGSFAVGRFEVTRGQFRAFVRVTSRAMTGGCDLWHGPAFRPDPSRDWQSPGYPQDDDHPVACVSWNDAQAYVVWLSRQTGKRYRLLTEAEWEYVARAGSRSRYYFGASEAELCRYANVADQAFLRAHPGGSGHTPCNDGSAATSPIGRFLPNAFGLHDVHGNLWEWVEDCYGPYSAAPSDGRAATGSSSCVRVIRGGSWQDVPRTLRSALRFGFTPDDRLIVVGFRVSRTLSVAGR